MQQAGGKRSEGEGGATDRERRMQQAGGKRSEDEGGATERERRRERRKNHDASEARFRRVFLNNDCSLISHRAARAAGLCFGGDFTYDGPSTFFRGNMLLPHGENGTQRGEFGHICYQGAWNMGRRHGKGCSYRANGSVEFDGEWFEDGYFDGEFYLPNGRLEYEGTFDHYKNLPHGTGTFYFSESAFSGRSE